jgi:flagellar hook-associated protein 3 FlgL
MRISTQQIYNIANVGMSDAQQAIVKTEEQIATGKRVLVPADDPIAATVILQVRDVLARGTQFQKNIDIAENVLELEEVTLDGIINLVTRMRELVIQSGNAAVLTESDYKAIAAEVDSRLDELLNLVNSRSAGGEYIFGGYQGRTQPFVSTGGGGYVYQGDEGALSIKVSSIAKVQVSDSGKKLFENIPSPVNTIKTSVSAANRSSPPITVSIGQVVDQEVFDRFHSRDMVISFNDVNNVIPAASNFTITERTSGRVIVANQVYQPGEEIVVNGVSIRIGGVPYPGTAAVAGSLQWGSDVAQNFAGDETGETLQIRVGARTETFTIGSNVTNDADVVTELTTGANAQLLANLGLSINTGVSPPRFEAASGLNVVIDPIGTSGPNILAALGLNSGAVSANGVPAIAGDSVFVESSKSQSVLNILARFSDALHQVKDGDRDTEALLGRVVSATLASLEGVETNLNSVQSEIGARLNTLASTRDMHADTELLNKEVLADLEDLDYAEAATRLSLQTFVLQATQQSFLRVSSLSLFSLL